MTPTQDVREITATARRILRRHFLTARMGITGVNFAVAETGTVVVVENEGNVRLAASMPEIHVAVMGIEKVIPRLADLAVLLKGMCCNFQKAASERWVGSIRLRLMHPPRTAC